MVVFGVGSGAGLFDVVVGLGLPGTAVPAPVIVLSSDDEYCAIKTGESRSCDCPRFEPKGESHSA